MPAKRPGRRKRELAVGEGGDQLTKKELSQLRDRAYIDARVTRLREITAKRVAAYERVLDFVERVEDSRMRNILTMRYIKCMSWQQIAGEIGGGNTANGLYKAHKRFLESEK